jgi:hypothetical protein
MDVAAQLAEQMSNARRRQEWWDTHYDELLARYPEQFVAVIGHEVVAARANLDDLLDDLEQSHADEQFEADIEFVTGDHGSLVL